MQRWDSCGCTARCTCSFAHALQRTAGGPQAAAWHSTPCSQHISAAAMRALLRTCPDIEQEKQQTPPNREKVHLWQRSQTPPPAPWARWRSPRPQSCNHSYKGGYECGCKCSPPEGVGTAAGHAGGAAMHPLGDHSMRALRPHAHALPPCTADHPPLLMHRTCRWLPAAQPPQQGRVPGSGRTRLFL